MLKFPEREPGETDDQWQTRIHEQYDRPKLEHGGGVPPTEGPQIPRFLRRPAFGPLALLVAGVTGAGVMWVYDRLSTPPTVPQTPVAAEVRSPIQFTIASDGEPTFTTPELVKAAGRVAEMEHFLKNVLIWPDIKINTHGTLALTEEELNKLLLNANVGGREAKWEFNNPGAGYNLNLTQTYEDDGRLSQRFLRLGLTNRVAELTKPYLDNAGLIRTESLDSVRRLALREPRVVSFGPYSVDYTNPAVVASARRGISVDFISGAQIQVVNDNRGLMRMWETETFYTNPG